MPSADAIYACDPTFWDASRDGTPYIDELRAHGAELWTQDEPAARKHDLRYIRSVGLAGLGRRYLHQGGNSGYQAVNLAFLWGAEMIVLLGFDMQTTGGRSHWFGNHPAGQGLNNPTVFDSWCANFRLMAIDLCDQGVTVVNATRHTALTCFARTTIDQLA